ncbi:apolipoprotein N-acyltransferase [Phaeacidiphilus oryzae]|uniref:apolipoprotein N-acyltransferase n=1 Tax=Phaeacidiphilus oryzae TaxID=348818 RepID=UPI000691B7DD|nr:apolipoprotein N-acyltransferase [Phaeacidiphilus oryzae]
MVVPVEPSADQSAESAEPSASTATRPEADPPRVGRLRRIAGAARANAARTGLAAAAGLALTLAFPPYGVWPLSVLAVTALSLLTRGVTWRQGAWTGFAFALPFFLWLLYWLNGSIGADAWLVLSPVEALYFALLGAALAVVGRLPWWPLWTACLWVGQEALRGRWPLGGFPWGRLSLTSADSPFAPLAAIGGQPLVGFAVALSGALLAAAVLTTRRARVGWAAVLVVAAVAVGAVGRFVPLPTAGQSSSAGPAYARIAIVQGNVPHAGMDFLGRPMQVLDNHVRETEKLAAEVAAGRVAKPDLVVWPENASDLDPYSYPEVYSAMDTAVRAIGVPVLIGTLTDAPGGRYYNESIVWDPTTGPGAHYAKQHLVPLGEYVPFRSVLTRFVTALRRIPVDFAPGHTPGVLKVGPAVIGEAICFEVAYDDVIGSAVDKGGRVLVVPTNNATYERTDQPEQQFTISRLRAMETGRAVVISATSGISGFIAPDGKVVAKTKLATAATVEERVPLRDQRTLADRLGAGPEWFLTGLGVLAWGAAMLRTRRRARS